MKIAGQVMIGALLVVAAPARAEPNAPAVGVVAQPVDPARLAVARELIDIMMPPATREQMMLGMLRPLFANLRQGMTGNPQFVSQMRSDPRAKALFDQFMARQEVRSTEMMREALPGMMPVMAAAYARRFDMRQLGDLKAFFQSSTGRVYMQAAFTIMSDPDVAAWQRAMMTQSMQHVQADTAAFAQQLAALGPKR